MKTKKIKMKPKFEIGDTVRHKTSGERGVITGAISSCTEHTIGIQCYANDFNCQTEFTGKYEISTGFNSEIEVDEILIEYTEGKK
ncbi:MAG: YccV family DNA-binding protein [Desulfobulbaceae bacterium]|nr:YccV family DNA-binding protein [Desulfobulbaceae bacterium]